MDENYYASPDEFEATSTPFGTPLLPGYVKGWAITDLVFCSLRVPLVMLGVVGLSMIPNTDPLYKTAIFEVITGAGICLFGLPGNIMLLLRKPLSIILCWITILATVGSIGVGVWQALIQYNNANPGTPEAAGMVVGIGITLTIRLALLVFYGIALSRAKSYFDAIVGDNGPQAGDW